MKHTSLLARAAAATVTLGTALAGTVVLTTSPAQAALQETDYGFYTFGFGTNVRVDTLGVESGPSAMSFLGCTRLAGKTDKVNLAGVQAPGNVALLSVGVVKNTSETFKRANGDVGSTSTAKVADLSLGAGEVKLKIVGLETSATAWADKSGKLHTAESAKLVDLEVHTGVPAVDDLLKELNLAPTINNLVATLLKLPDDQLVLPGIGAILLGRKDSTITAGAAKSNSVALRILLFGSDQKIGGGDDISVVVGRAHARVYRDMPAGVMNGYGAALEGSVLNDTVNLGPVAKQRLDCHGTRGKIGSNATAGVNLLNMGAIGVHAAEGRAFGIQRQDNSATAWTEGRIANVNLGGDAGLTIKGIVGHAEVNKSKNGTLTKSTNGTEFVAIIANGKKYTLDLFGKDKKLEIPGIATIRYGITNETRNSISVIALQVVLVPALAEKTGLATVNLGIAKVKLKKL